MPDNDNPLFQLAYDLVNFTGMHLFLTGEAGTGKTTFLHYLKSHTHKQYAVAAPTGVAAINAGGTTLHSLFMLPVGGVFVPSGSAGQWASEDLPFQVYDRHSLITRTHMPLAKRQLLQQLELLIIDEVSMLRADTLDMIDVILRAVRKNRKPFGGVQLLFIGDLFQLDPVSKGAENTLLSAHYISNLFIDAQVIKEAPPKFIELKKVYRQRDSNFLQLLNRVRRHQLDAETLAALNARRVAEASADMITVTSHNRIADAINQKQLSAIPDDAVDLPAAIEGKFPENGFPADKALSLKPGARVMFIKNDSGAQRQYFNGKMGTVVSIGEDELQVKGDEDNLPVSVGRSSWDNVRYRWNEEQKSMEEELLGTFRQFPLRLAWAVSIHKSQGLTFNRMAIDAAQSFAAGQVYVALSRATSLDGIYLLSNLQAASIQVNARVEQFYSYDRPVEPLMAQVTAEKQSFVQQTLRTLFSFNQHLSRLIAAKTMLLQIPAMEAQGLNEWLQSVKAMLDKANAHMAPVQQPLDEAIDALYAADGEANLNDIINKLVPELISNTAPAFAALQKSLSTAAPWIDEAIHENLITAVEELLAGIQKQLADLVRISKGFSEVAFFGRVNLARHVQQNEGQVTPNAAESRHAAPQPNFAPDLLVLLKNHVRQIAAAENMPVYVISNFSALEWVAACLPKSLEELGQLPGFGKTKVAKIGEALLTIVADWHAQNPDFLPQPYKTPKDKKRKAKKAFG